MAHGEVLPVVPAWDVEAIIMVHEGEVEEEEEEVVVVVVAVEEQVQQEWAHEDFDQLDHASFSPRSVSRWPIAP